ncbi:MAG: MYXO-CTERM sorting domain-containing protein, partial [Myxococcota bacterium]
MAEVAQVDLEDGRGLEEDDVDLDGDGGLVGIIVDLFGSLFGSLLIDPLQDQVGSLANDLITEQLCQTPGEVGCPTGSSDRDGVCIDDTTGECAPIVLGMEGQGDVGSSLLGGFAPGVHGRLRFLAALAGDGRMRNGGISLSMAGGTQSLDETLTEFPGHNPCVPATDPPVLPDVSISEKLEDNSFPGVGTAHVGIGVSEQFIDHAAWHVFDSGMLCIGAGTSLAQELSTGLFSLVVGSLNNLTFPESNQPLAMMIRPQAPPDIDIGDTMAGHAVMNVTLPETEIDFYVWSQERYVRFMTYKADLSLDVDLMVDSAAGTLSPVIGEVVADNAEILNSELLREDPAMLAETITGVIGSFAGMLTGSLAGSGIELPEIEGFKLLVPEGGIQGFEDGGDRFLGIFANLELANDSASTMAAHPTETEIEDVEVSLDPRSLQLETWNQGEPTTIRARAEAFGTGVDYEYSYRLDGMEWSAWTDDPELVITDDVLQLQARHTLEVRSRVAGLPRTVDPTPASEPILVDVQAPQVQTEQTDEGVRVVAADVVTPRDQLEYRHRRDGSEWSEWAAYGDGPVLDAESEADVEVEVRDEARNVGSNRQALIRGLPDPSGGGACDCAVPGSGSGSTPLAGLGILLALGAVLRRRRRWQKRSPEGTALTTRVLRTARRMLPFLALPLALYVTGCGGSDGAGACDEDCVAATYDTNMGGICCPAMNMCVDYSLNDLCSGVEACEEDSVQIDRECETSCAECIIPPNTPGQIATYLDMTALADDTLVISGYNPGNPGFDPPRRFGDLVVGVYDGTDIEWETVDGAPDGPVQLQEGTWRNGVIAPGEDVGLWTSIASADDDTLYVSYYDRDNGALKIAVGSPGSWAVHTVEDAGDYGQHTSIVLESGAPRVAYLQIEPAAEDGQRPTARARVAMADGATPAGPDDWNVTTAHEVTIDCRPQWCPDGTTCVASGACLADTTDEEELADPFIEDLPVATGLYNTLFTDGEGLALVLYDRTAGVLRSARWTGDAWAAGVDIDGYGVAGSSSGDSGLANSVFVEGDVWHVSYLDGTEENLMYARVEESGGSVNDRQVVDDGAVMNQRDVIGYDSS